MVPEYGPIGMSELPEKRTLKITSFGMILRAPNHGGHTNVKRSSLHQTNWRTLTMTVITTSNELANIKHDSHRYVERIGTHQAQHSLLSQTNQWTSSTTIIATSNELANIKHDSHRYVERIGTHQSQHSLLSRTNQWTSITTVIATSNESTNIIAKSNGSLRRWRNPQAASISQDVHICTSRFTRKIHMHTHKPLRAHKTYTYVKYA